MATALRVHKKTEKVNLSKSSYATGRRKEAAARVWLIMGGSGVITINGKKSDQYFSQNSHRFSISKPFATVGTGGVYDAVITVKGGGMTGQCDAIIHGISRALADTDETYRTTLREEGLLTRDSRKVERKKYGRKKARKRFQFSKR